MIFNKIEVSNFKSFKDISIDLRNLNILIGANASGKTNFLQIFKFIRDYSKHGLINAVSLQGGFKYLKNAVLGDTKDFRINFNVNINNQAGIINKKDTDIGIVINNLDYELDLKFYASKDDFKAFYENMILKIDFIELVREKDNISEKGKIGKAKIIIENRKGKTSIKTDSLRDINIKEDEITNQIYFTKLLKNIMKKEKINEPYLFNLFAIGYFNFIFNEKSPFSDIAVYDFDLNMAKRVIQITGKDDFEEDGSNLALVLNNIIRNPKNKKRLISLFKRILPSIEDIETEEVAGKDLLFKFKDTYASNLYLPSSLLSAGTINITSLIIALYFDKKPIVLIEEPEKNIHPYLISKIAGILKEESKNKQIIITTHTPEILKYVDLEDILLVERSKEGFSNIFRPSETDRVKDFLKHKIGIEDLYIQNILGS